MNENTHSDTDSNSTLHSDEEIEEFYEDNSIHKSLIQIINKKMSQESETIVPATQTEKILFEQLQAMHQTVTSLQAELKILKGSRNEPSAPPAPTTISVDSHRLVKELLNEIRTFDGSSNVEYFLDQLRSARDQLETEAEQKALLRKVIASRLIGEAARVGESTQGNCFADLANALRASFGQADLTYEQISEIRNNTRQGQNESIDSYVKRYEELHRRVQKSIDHLKIEYRVGIRYIEEDSHIRRFIQSLKPEIEVRLLNMKIESLRHAIQEARAVDKRLRDDEVIRSRTQRKGESSSQIKNNVRYDNIKHDNKIDRKNDIKNDFKNETKNNFKKSCSFCNKLNHNENECWRKNPQLRNFQKNQLTDKGPPRKYLMEDMEELSVTSDPEENIMTSTSNCMEQQEFTDFWSTPEPQNQS